MAKKAAASGHNKSELIRDYKKNDPNLGPKAIAGLMMSEHGEDVSAQFVSTVLSMAKKRDGKGVRRGRGRPPGSGKAASKVAAKSGVGISVDLLVKAKKLAKELGGVEEAKAALDALARLMD